MVKLPKRVTKFVKVLRRQEQFTMRETSIVDNLLQLVNSRPNPQILEEIKQRVRELRRVEFREHFTASGKKVASRMHKMFRLSMFSPSARSKFKAVSDQIEVWYAKLIVDTAQGLWAEVNKRTVGQVDWKKVKQHINDLRTDISALTAAEQQAEQIAPVKP